MGAPQVVPRLHPLRILPDPGMPPEARNPGPITRLERIALAQELTANSQQRTAIAMETLATRFGEVADRMAQDAAEMEKLIANGGSLAAQSAAETINEGVRQLAKALGQNWGKSRAASPEPRAKTARPA
jgi:hypothetical protein